MPRNTTASPRMQPASSRAGASGKPVVQTSKVTAPIEHAISEEARTSGQRRLSKLDQLVGLLRRPEGASLADLASLTGWQAHSIRGAIAGSLKRKCHVVSSDRIDGTRRYRIVVAP